MAKKNKCLKEESDWTVFSQLFLASETLWKNGTH